MTENHCPLAAADYRFIAPQIIHKCSLDSLKCMKTRSFLYSLQGIPWKLSHRSNAPHFGKQDTEQTIWEDPRKRLAPLQCPYNQSDSKHSRSMYMFFPLKNEILDSWLNWNPVLVIKHLNLSNWSKPMAGSQLNLWNLWTSFCYFRHIRSF